MALLYLLKVLLLRRLEMGIESVCKVYTTSKRSFTKEFSSNWFLSFLFCFSITVPELELDPGHLVQSHDPSIGSMGLFGVLLGLSAKKNYIKNMLHDC